MDTIIPDKCMLACTGWDPSKCDKVYLTISVLLIYPYCTHPGIVNIGFINAGNLKLGSLQIGFLFTVYTCDKLSDLWELRQTSINVCLSFSVICFEISLISLVTSESFWLFFSLHVVYTYCSYANNHTNLSVYITQLIVIFCILVKLFPLLSADISHLIFQDLFIFCSNTGLTWNH